MMAKAFSTFNELVKNLRKPASGLKELRVALLSDFSAQYLSKAIRAAAILAGFDVKMWNADYDSIETTVYDEHSDLYGWKPQYVILLFSPRKLYRRFSFHSESQDFANSIISELSALITTVHERTGARIIIGNLPESDDSVFGNYSNRYLSSFVFQQRMLNLELMKFASNSKNLSILDIQSLFVLTGRPYAVDSKLYIHGDVVYSLDFTALLAERIMQIVKTLEGSFVKCVILDLDNTLWGGVIGDDGIDRIEIGSLGIGKAFSEFQLWLRNLKNRGIILAVCSKNNETTAKDVFLNHPEMILRPEDISVFVANWETKVDNLYFIQSILSIGFDSMVFLDDNPFERSIVKQNIPDIIVPDLPEDPAEFLDFLQSLNLFETSIVSEEDSYRAKMYQEETQRASFKKIFASENEFLASLEMTAEWVPFNQYNRSRVAQLTQRSNQFNLRTVRYTDDEITQTMQDVTRYGFALSLKDIYGEYGIISVVILQLTAQHELFIDTWVMSCRVLKRGVERFVMNEIHCLAEELGAARIIGEYLPTKKNTLVQHHYQELGFEREDETRWSINTRSYNPSLTFIQKKQHAIS